MKFSKYFQLGKEQAELDFVDVNPSADTRLFVDPYAISIRRDMWSQDCGDSLRSFFQEVLEALRKSDSYRIATLMSQLSEPRETYLGMSRGTPKGRGVGRFQATQIASALRSSQAFQTGLLADLSDAELFIEGIGPDKISDLTTNVIRGNLIRYTQEQCELHGITKLREVAVGPVWNSTHTRWEAGYRSVPIVQGKPVILVPKFSVRSRLCLDSQEFYNHHMIEFLRQEYESAGHSLVHILKNGTRRVYKKDVKERHPFAKDHLADFALKHPKVLDLYKKIAGAKGALDSEDMVDGFKDHEFAKALRTALKNIPAGMKSAGEYHSFMIGALTFLFYPDLIEPVKEKEIHEGRKRIDLVYTNSASEGFFHRVLAWPSTRAIKVMIECKNYSKEMGNPELDQLTGRFGHQRGFFGIIVCRAISNRAKLILSCKDAANDTRGYMLALDDEDIDRMLAFVEKRQRPEISRYLSARLDALNM
ncbi:MAG: hypothetical protein U1E67_13595 [Hyphomicrobiales bacterium]